MGYRRRSPDVWSRCKSYPELARALVLGESKAPPETIEAYQNYDEAQVFLEQWKERIAKAERDAAKAYEESVRAQEEHAKEMEDLGLNQQTDISTKRGGISVDPFKPILFPVQQNLAMLCRYFRHVKYILIWEECYLSFWIVTACILLGLVFLFVPWFFLLKWTARALVWTFFGPWMKLADLLYVSKVQPLTEEELEQKKTRERERRRLLTSAAATKSRIKREDAAKLKAMKKFMFGRYITRVPVLKEDRYLDLPLPESTAVPYDPGFLPLSELAMREAGYGRIRLPGQHLVGDMIPRVSINSQITVCCPLRTIQRSGLCFKQLESPYFTEAPIGQATARPGLVDAKGPGGGTSFGPDSDADAYAKIASLFVAAGVVTWFGVPVLSAATEAFLGWITTAR